MNIAERRDGITEASLQRVGTILNRKWRLDGLLGVGGSAAVYAATHRNGNRVAIKLLHAHFSLDEVVRERLQQEGYVANLIEHPGAVRILDDDLSEDGHVFLVMELLAGEGLDARLKRKGWRLPRPEALGITFSLLDVLAAAHSKGVIHRDIKPDNVFVTRDGQIKVLDFGIARVLDLPPGVNRTRNGALFGTLGFMAPEQALARANEIDARTDLWAVGATLFTLLSGRLVHEAPTPNEQLVNAATRPAPALASVLPDVDPLLAALVDRALAFHPADRWQSAPEMQDIVREVAMATCGPLGVPMLQGPRVSVEVDLDAVGEARGRWASSSFSSLRPSLMQEPAAPTMFVHGPPPRRSRAVWFAAAGGLLLAAGLGKLAWSQHQRSLGADHGSLTAPDFAAARDLAATPSLGSAASAAGPELAPVRRPIELAQALGAPGSPRAADQAATEVVRPRRRVMRTVVRANPATAAPQSIAGNDAVWGRRH